MREMKVNRESREFEIDDRPQGPIRLHERKGLGLLMMALIRIQEAILRLVRSH